MLLRRLVIALVLVGVVFLAFGHSLWQDFAPIDDTLLVRENLAIRGFSWENIRYVFTHFDPELFIPLTFISFQFNYVLGGLDPFGFHLGNILLHVANAYLVFVVIRTLIGNSVAAFTGALIFAVHPLHTEAVVWIAGRKDVLFTFFYLLTLILYLRGKNMSGPRARMYYGASVFFALLAMLSKATAMTLPVVLILLDWFLVSNNVGQEPDCTQASSGKHFCPTFLECFLNKIPFFLLSAVFAFVALGGKERVVGSTPMIDIGLVALRSFGHYLRQLFVPIGFNVFYQQRDPVSIIDPHVAIPLIALLSLISLSWYFRKRKPWIAFGFLFYFITLSPTFFNFHKGLISFYAVDRYAYLPSIGIILIVVMLLKSILNKNSKSVIIFHVPLVSAKAGAEVGFSIFNSVPVVVLATMLILLSRHQTRVWDSPETLYRHAVAADPMSVPARATLAQVLRQTGRNVEAFSVLKEGLAYGDDVSYHLEAGNVYAANGQIADAIGAFTKASHMKPDLPEPYFSIGNLEEHRGNVDLALEYYRKALALDPSYTGARVRIADILIDRKEFAEAEEQLAEALRWNPSYFGANMQMYRLRKAQGREGEAEVYLEKAMALRPGEVTDQ